MSLKKVIEYLSGQHFDLAQPAERTRLWDPALQLEKETPRVSGGGQVTTPRGRYQRIESEVLMIAEHFAKYEGVNFDEENGDWLIIPKYPLPEKWRDRWCKLLIIFPETYPVSPPTGFYLNKKFRLKNGGADPHLTGSAYHGAADLQALGWEWYCVTIKNISQGGWKPTLDYRKPDNLWTFLALVRECLTNDV